MNPMNEKEIRERLERAVAPIDPVAPPLDAIRERAVKLRRFRISAGGGLLAAAAAAVTVAVVVVPANGSQNAHVAAAPSQASLTQYASAHDGNGKHVAGPVADGTHYVGAYTTEQAIVVAEYAGGSWTTVRSFTSYGDGQYVLKLADGGSVIPGHASFAVRTRGGDVSYFGGVIYDAAGMWKGAHFSKCVHHKALSCAYAGGSEPYGHVVNGHFVSIHNNCLPYCAAGTDYRVVWRWDDSEQQFNAASITAIKS